MAYGQGVLEYILRPKVDRFTAVDEENGLLVPRHGHHGRHLWGRSLHKTLWYFVENVWVCCEFGVGREAGGRPHTAGSPSGPSGASRTCRGAWVSLLNSFDITVSIT